jgi:translocation and assembly module TamA
MKPLRSAAGPGAPVRAVILLIALAVAPAVLAADRIRIEVDGVERAIADNVRAFLSLSRYTQRDDLTDAQVRRLADRAVDEATDALRPFGYYEPSVRSRTTRDDENWIVRLRIEPGEPVRLDQVDVVIDGEGQSDHALRSVVAESPVHPGARLDHAEYEALKTSLLRIAQERGYLDVKLRRRELIVDPARRSADVHLAVETGGRYKFGRIEIKQDAIDPKLLQSYIRFREGDPFLAEQLRNTQFALEDSNYFSVVTTTAGDRDPETMTVPITLHGERVARNRYTVSLGYGTDTGVRGKFSWDNRLVNRRGHRMEVELTASKIKDELIARYIIPVGDPSLEKLEFSSAYIREELGDLDSERYELTGSYTEVLGRWQRVLFLKLNQEETSTNGDSQSDLLLIPGVSSSSLPPNFLTGWVRDAAYYAELSGSPETLGSDASYLRFYGRAEKVWPIRGPWWVRVRGEVGASWVNDFSELPASQRFFAGGDRSVRGYGINELSPRVDVENSDGTIESKAVGGENKLVGSVEIERDFPRNFRGTVFVDTGNAFNDWADQQLVYSVGLGVRWKLPMLMIGVDIAQSLSDSDQRPRLHLNITQVL